MCLTTTKYCFRYAKQDIVCYKVLFYSSNYDVYRTPYKMAAIPNNVLSGEQTFKAEGRGITRCLGNNEKEIYGGYIHVFKTLEDAKYFCDNSDDIFECIIPQGTRYAKGTFDCRNAYAAKEIRFVKKVNKYLMKS